VALTVTTLGFGTLTGARYVPEALMVPDALLPPAMPLTFQMTPVLLLFCTDAVNVVFLLVRTVALVGEMLIATGCGATTFT
jgi:hypothetical protein